MTKYIAQVHPTVMCLDYTNATTRWEEHIPVITLVSLKPEFGLTQSTLLIGSMHWLIQTAHLLVGLGALALIAGISTRYLRLKQPVPEVATPPQAVR